MAGTTRSWLGNAQAIAQVQTYAPGPQVPGTAIVGTINGKTVTYTSSTGTNDDLIAGLVTAWKASTMPEFKEVTPAGVAYSPIVLPPNATYLQLTAATPGIPFTATISLVTPANVSVTRVQAGKNGVNELQKITIGPNAMNASTFTLTFGGNTTPAINLPPSAPSAATGAAGNLTGNYQWLLTAKSTAGDIGETEPSLTSATLALTAQQATITLPTYPPGGGFNLYRTLAGGTTFYYVATINSGATYTDNATDSAIKTNPNPPTTNGCLLGALEGLASIGQGNVRVGGANTAAYTGMSMPTLPIVYEIEFVGTLGGAAQALLTGDVSNVSILPIITVTTTQTGCPPQNEIQVVGWQQVYGVHPVTGSFTVTLPNIGGVSVTTGPLAANVAPNSLQSALVAACQAAGLGTTYNNAFAVAAYVSPTFPNTSTNPNLNGLFQITYQGPLALTDVPQATADVSKMVAGSGDAVCGYMQTLQQGSATGHNHIVTVALNDAPTSGSWSLTVTLADGNTVSASGLAYNASASAVQTAFPLGAEFVNATGNVGGPYTLEFIGEAGLQQITVVASSALVRALGAATFTAAELIAGAAAVNEIQQITINGATGGTFVLAVGGFATQSIAYNATASTVLGDLTALPSIGASNVSVSGSAGGPFTVTYQGALAGAPQPRLGAITSSLQGTATTNGSLTTVTASTGPWNWDNAANWSPAGVPVSGDLVYFQNNNVACLYGLAQSAVLLNTLQVDMSYLGSIGLPNWNTKKYSEYRQQYLQIGVSGKILIGNGKGTGPSLVKLDTGVHAANMEINGTGTSADPSLPVVIWKGNRSPATSTGADTTVTITKGSFGAAVFAGETAIIDTLRQSYQTNQRSDTFVQLGAGATLTTWQKDGGDAKCYTSINTLTQTGGTCTLYDGTSTPSTVGSLILEGGTFSHDATGLVTVCTVGTGATYDRSLDSRPVQINSCYLYGKSTFLDPQASIAFVTPLELVNCSLTDVTLDLGSGIALTRTKL